MVPTRPPHPATTRWWLAPRRVFFLLSGQRPFAPSDLLYRPPPTTSVSCFILSQPRQHTRIHTYLLTMGLGPPSRLLHRYVSCCFVRFPRLSSAAAISPSHVTDRAATWEVSFIHQGWCDINHSGGIPSMNAWSLAPSCRGVVGDLGDYNMNGKAPYTYHSPHATTTVTTMTHSNPLQGLCCGLRALKRRLKHHV